MKTAGKIILIVDVLLLFAAFFVARIYWQDKDSKQTKKPPTSVGAESDNVTSSPTNSTSDKTKKPNPTTNLPVETAPPESKQETIITFTGDVLLTDYMINNYKRDGIKGLVDQKLYDLLYNADINMINQEFPFSNRGTPMVNKEYTFRASTEHVKIFKDMGVDIVTLANNHTLDYGTEALLDTFTTLEEAGISYVGAGKNLDRAKKIEYFEVNGYRIAFVGASRVLPIVDWYATSSRPGILSTYDSTITREQIKEAKEQADYVVVYVHWGKEHTERPVAYQRNMGKEYIDSGADIVVGSHTHSLQGVEFYQGKPIVYSLGNFIFSRNTTETAMIALIIDEDGKLNLAMYPCKAEKGLTAMVTDEEEVKKFNAYMESISYDISIDENQILRLSD